MGKFSNNTKSNSIGKYIDIQAKNAPFYKSVFFWLCVVLVGLGVWFLIPVIIIAWLIYEKLYFNSQKFQEIKNRIADYIHDCNELNRHIEYLKEFNIGSNRLDAGIASYSDSSNWKFQRKELAKQEVAPNVYNCSRTVCDGARKEPFRYICKYFNISISEDSLEQFEKTLNNFEAAEDGIVALQAEKNEIVKTIADQIPFLIKRFSKKTERELGFESIDLSSPHYPKYAFQYISSGGNASTRCDIVLDTDNLNRFVEYLSQRIKFNKSVAGQRALMTSRLRQYIKERDNYTCQSCGLSIYQEPNLLLEIDHIVPVSKGGLTAEDNLQTLCWRCNRSKGAKM